jgi:hypothetical protein
VTRLPTKNVWQLLCWAFIVAKSTGPETAPMLVYRLLLVANMEFYKQIIHKGLWTICGTKTGSQDPDHARQEVAQKAGSNMCIVASATLNQITRTC